MSKLRTAVVGVGYLGRFHAQKHRALDSAIFALHDTGSGDALQLARLKKRKLTLKDQIAWIENELTPDIIA